MDLSEAEAVLRKAFGVLTAEERANVRKHLEKGTPILCGAQAHLFASADGGM